MKSLLTALTPAQQQFLDMNLNSEWMTTGYLIQLLQFHVGSGHRFHLSELVDFGAVEEVRKPGVLPMIYLAIKT